MAIVTARLSFSLLDNRGGRGNFLRHMTVSDASTLAAVNTAIGVEATNFATVSSAGIKVAEFTLINDAVATDATVPSNISAGAVVDYANAALVTRTYGQLVPSFLPSLISADGTIDISAGATAAFIAAEIAETLGGQLTDSDYLDLIDGLRAFQSDRKRKRAGRL